MRKNLLYAFIMVLVFVFVFSISCGKKSNVSEKKEEVKKAEEAKKGESETTQSQKNANTPQDALAQIQQFTERMKKASEEQLGGKIIVLDEDKMKSVLPEVSGWKIDGKPYFEKSKFGAMETSTMDATYINGDKSVTVKITDTGTAASMLSFLKMAISMHISNETSDGYERVIDFKGYKGIEKFNKNDKTGEITLLVNDRFIVEVSGSEGVSIDTLKEFLSKTKLSNLK